MSVLTSVQNLQVLTLSPAMSEFSLSELTQTLTMASTQMPGLVLLVSQCLRGLGDLLPAVHVQSRWEPKNVEEPLFDVLSQLSMIFRSVAGVALENIKRLLLNLYVFNGITHAYLSQETGKDY